MKVTINKSNPVGSITAPPSKSYAHRMIICAALANGKSVVKNIALSADIKATLECIKSLGASYEISDCEITINGCGGEIKRESVFECSESGSTLRFFIPPAVVRENETLFKGTDRLIERGVGIYEEILPKHGVIIEKNKDGILVSGRLQSGDYKIRGNVSSQFISGMMFALPLLDGDSTIEIIPPFESKQYVDVTIDVLKKFGIEITETSENKFSICGTQKYLPCDCVVEGDWSNGAFFYALNALSGNINIYGLEKDSLQGDKVCVDAFERIKTKNDIIDISDCPDLGPVLFAFAAIIGQGEFVGTKRLAIKESNRAECMAQELEKFGIAVDVEENRVSIKGTLSKPKIILNGHNDHRIVMALSVLSTITGGTIDGVEAVNKSFPDFFDNLKQVGVILELWN